MAAPSVASMPRALDLQQGYTIRVTALDPSTGNLAAGVKITTVVLTADPSSVIVGTGGGGSGEWFLVPGPNA